MQVVGVLRILVSKIIFLTKTASRERLIYASSFAREFTMEILLVLFVLVTIHSKAYFADAIIDAILQILQSWLKI